MPSLWGLWGGPWRVPRSFGKSWMDPCGGLGCALGSLRGCWDGSGRGCGCISGFLAALDHGETVGFYSVFNIGRARVGPGGSLGVARSLGAPPGLGGFLGDHLRVFEKSDASKRILGGIVIDWCGPWGACVSLGGWSKELCPSLIRVWGPGHPLSYKLKLISRRKIGRSEI